MTSRALTITLVIAAVAATVGCGSSGHTTAGQPAAGNAAAAGSGLPGKIVFRRFFNDATATAHCL